MTSSCAVVSTHTLRTDAHAATSDNQDLLNKGLKRFWDLETLGIKENESSVYDEFERNVTSRNGRYDVRLPWKEPHPVLPNNHELCSRRLVGLLKRLRQNPQVLMEYDTVIKDQLSKGVVEVVEEHPQDDREVHYVPHHAVDQQGMMVVCLLGITIRPQRSTIVNSTMKF